MVQTTHSKTTTGYRHILIAGSKTTTHCGKGTRGWILNTSAAKRVAVHHKEELCSECRKHLT